MNPFKVQDIDLIDTENSHFERFIGVDELYMTDFGDQVKEIPHKLLMVVGPSLLKFACYNNGIEFLPDNFDMLMNLTYLNLRDNRLVSLPESFGQFYNLKELFLFNQKMNDFKKILLWSFLYHSPILLI